MSSVLLKDNEVLLEQLYMSRFMANKNKKMSSFKSNKNIHKKDELYYVVSANKASSATVWWSGNESHRKHTTILQISNRQSIQNGVQIFQTCLEYESKPIIYFWFLRILTLISKDQK